MTNTITLPNDTITNLANLADDHFEFGTLLSCYLDIRLNEDFFNRLWREHSFNPTASLVLKHNHGRLTDQEFSQLLNQELARFYGIAAEFIVEDFDISEETAAKVFELAALDAEREGEVEPEDIHQDDQEATKISLAYRTVKANINDLRQIARECYVKPIAELNDRMVSREITRQRYEMLSSEITENFMDAIVFHINEVLGCELTPLQAAKVYIAAEEDCRAEMAGDLI